MKVNTVDSNKIEIQLSEDEVKRIFGGYGFIDYDTPDCRMKIHNLLAAAIPETLLPLDCDRLLIEVKPLRHGCSILLTKIYSKRRSSLKKNAKYLTMIFENSEDLISALPLIAGIRFYTSELYCLGEKYALVASLSAPDNKTRINLGEYCRISDSIALSCKVREYWHCVTKRNAVINLAEAFLK